MRNITRFFIFLTVFSFLYVCKTNLAHATTSTFTYDDSIFANPERGFLHFGCGDSSISSLSSYRSSEAISLMMCNFYLNPNGPISTTTLNTLKSDLANLRAAGLKVILRFAYTDSRTGVNASYSQINSHIDQLAPILQANKDVILVWQAGFIGAWGEWYYTSNSSNDFGDQGVISTSQWANRKSIVDKMLSVLPNTYLSLRTPLFKRTLYGTGIDPLSRIGHHNDAFVASPDDYGTYVNKSIEYPYLSEDTKNVPMGGENDNYDTARTNCTIAMQEMALFHWTYINSDYYQPTLSNWSSQGCLDQMKKKLGYRFSITDATYPNSFNPGQNINITLNFKNDGFTTPFNPRPVFLVLYNSNNTYTFQLQTDPKKWLSGTTTSINQVISIPANVIAGNYNLAVWLPDNDSGLKSKSYYSIRLANANTWDATLGYNKIGSNIIVGNSSNQPRVGDVNGDGVVNIVDIGMTIDHYGEAADKMPKADINNDGIINIVDIGIIIDNYQ